MATTFDSVYDAFVSICQAEIGTNLELPNPYELERNAPTQLEKGWGVTVGASTVFTDQFDSTGEEIPFNVVLTAASLGPEMSTTRISDALKAIKQMDLDTRKRLVQPDQIGVPNAGVFFLGSSEVEFITGNDSGSLPLSDQDVVAVITINYAVRIIESLI